MIRILWFFLALFLATAAEAKTVRVTSGEHNGFTRLVLKVDPASDWTLEEAGKRATLVFPDKSYTFQDSRIFERIPKTRLLAIEQGQEQGATRFAMTLACPCDVQAYAYQGAYIVVDIHDSSVPLPKDPVIESVTDTPGISALPPPVLQEDSYRFAPVVRQAPPVLEQPETAIEAPSVISAEMRDNMKETTDKNEADLQITVEEARTKLLEQLTFAAEMGLVNFEDAKGPVAGVADEIPETVSEPEETAQPKPEHPVDITEKPETPMEDQLVITSVYERDGRQPLISPNAGLENCPTDVQLDIAAWGNGDDFSNQLSALRSKLLKEFDSPDPQAATDLVKLYIRFGFGVEAQGYLQDYSDVIPDPALLKDMALVMDGKPAEKDGPLVRAAGCAGPAGLWSMVGMYPDIYEGEVKDRSILSAFSDLPPDVRRILGPRLVQAFSDMDMIGSARLVSEIMERAPGEKSEFQRLTAARLAAEQGDIETATTIYQDLVLKNSNATITALIELSALLLAEDAHAPETLIADLGAAADEVRGTRDGYELRRLEALWLQKKQGGLAALDLIAKERDIPDLDPRAFSRIAAEIFFAMSPEDDGPSNYAKAVTNYLYLVEGVERDDSLMLDIGQKLIDAGLPNMSLKLLAEFDDSKSNNIRIVLARAFLANFDPEKALDKLNGLTDRAAGELKVQALLNMGDFHRALAEINGLSLDETFKPDLSWYSGDWMLAAQQDKAAQEILQIVVGDMGQATTDSSQTGGMGRVLTPTLAETTALLERSTVVSDELKSIFNSGSVASE